MIEFSDLIEDMDFVDLQLVGGNYTWFKGDNNNVASRIDRILISKEWMLTLAEFNKWCYRDCAHITFPLLYNVELGSKTNPIFQV